MEARLCLEAAERPQWPRVYSLNRPRSRGRMLSLVGDSGQVLGVQAGLTRMRNLPFVPYCRRQLGIQQWLCVEQSCELCTDIRGRGGASNVH